MAQRYLLTRARTAAAGPLYPGTLLDDAQDDVAAILATGARTYLAPDATIAEASDLCARLRLRGGTAEQAESIMLEAAARAGIAASSSALASAYAELSTDFGIAQEDPPIWHDVLTATIATGGGTSLRVLALWAGADAALPGVVKLQVLVDGQRPVAGGAGMLTGISVLDPVEEAECGGILARVAVAAGSHEVKLQAKNSSPGANFVILASTSPEIHRASLEVDEVA